MAKNRKGNGSYYYMYFSAALICVIVAIIIASILAFVNFEGDSDPEAESSRETSQVSQVTSTEIPSVSAETSDSPLDGIAMDDLVVNNSSVRDGKVAIITWEDEQFRTADSLDLVRFYGNKGEGYELSGTAVKADREALESFDAFLVSFAEVLPGSGIIIDKGYCDKEALVSGGNFEEFADLTSGSSVMLGISGTSRSFNDAEFAYLPEQAFKYGIILRYPENKESATNHTASKKLYRYIGVEHTQYMNIYNLTLEEYIDSLKSNDRPIEVTDTLGGNKKYIIYYVEMTGGAGDTTVIPVPASLPYEISGDGKNGFVVTVTVEK